MGLLKKNFIFQDVNELKGVGTKLSRYLKNKKIEKIKDIILHLPYSETDRSKISELRQLEIGKIQTIKVIVKKLNFPRIRNLPNRIMCEDDTGKIDIIYFNSREGYLRKIFPLNETVIISGKVNFFRNKYQITNPDYVTSIDKQEYVTKNIPKYNLTKGINEKKYRQISEQVTQNLPVIEDWLSEEFIKQNNLLNWNDAIKKLHNSDESKNNKSKSFRRIVFDEICANFLTLSENRKRIKKEKKNKIFNEIFAKRIIKQLPFQLTKSQKKVLDEINIDLKSNERMFRIIQGDVGSGKTIVSLISMANVIEAKYQCALMGPTEILSLQHYELAKKIFKNSSIKVEFLSGKTDPIKKREILSGIKNGEINLLIGTHALFQKKINFKKLGFVVIDEQHKFGVKQRSELAQKGGSNCDVLLMSATPIPRTMMMSNYGDMDMKKSIMLFRYDLRLHDNPALSEALSADECYPIYVFDSQSSRSIGEASHVWLHQALESLRNDLNGHLSFYKGITYEVILNLVESYDIDGVFFSTKFPTKFFTESSCSDKPEFKINVSAASLCEYFMA